MASCGRIALLTVLLSCVPSEDLGSYTGGEPGGAAPAAGTAGSAGQSGSDAGSSSAPPDDPEGPTEAPSDPGAGEGDLPRELDPGLGVGGAGTGGSGSVVPSEGGGAGGTAEPNPASAPEVRFVRLIADSSIAQDPYTSIAEFSVLDEAGEPIDTAGWLVSADSSEQVFVGGAPPEMAIDGLAGTMWHTPWFEVVPPPHPHVFEVDLGQLQRVSGFRYLPRQDGAQDGRIDAYRFFVSVDGVSFGEPLLAGTLGNSDTATDVRTEP